MLNKRRADAAGDPDPGGNAMRDARGLEELSVPLKVASFEAPGFKDFAQLKDPY